MEDKPLEHGPLELLVTVDEETGLTGAHTLQPGFAESRTLINLDSEEEGALYVGCAGGKDTTDTWTVDSEKAPATMAALDVNVTGLRGGHSGLEIDKGRGNAIKIVNHVLIALSDGCGARLSTINGGNNHNAIPRECLALVFVATTKLADAKPLVAHWNDIAREELKTVEPDLKVSAEILWLVETSTSVAVIMTAGKKIQLTRASAAPSRQESTRSRRP